MSVLDIIQTHFLDGILIKLFVRTLFIIPME